MDNQKSKDFNMQIWNQVCVSDPKFCKSVPRGKKFKLTAIDAQSQIKRATELWGPMGYRWGVKDPCFRELEKSDILLYYAVLFYPADEDENKEGFLTGCGEIPICSDIKLEVGRDCVKCVATDALTKGLSRLGFNSDVFEGKFDDNKYVQGLKKETKTKPTKESTGTSKPPKPNPVESRILGRIATCMTEELQSAGDQATKKYVDFDLLCKVVWEKWGSYPSKEDSVEKAVEGLSLDEVTRENDFVKGL